MNPVESLFILYLVIFISGITSKAAFYLNNNVKDVQYMLNDVLQPAMDPGEMVHSISREMSGFDKIKEEVMKAKLFNKSNHQGGVKDQSTDPYIFLSDKLPTNNKYMATIGNGFLATVVYGDTVYMNGVYNGFYDHSHRARIPSTGAIQFSLDGKYNGNENYALDVRKGIFYHRVNGTGFTVEQRTYAHQYYTRLYVNDIVIQRTDKSTAPINLKLTNNYGPDSNDFYFKKNPVVKGVGSMSGPIRMPETHFSGTPEVFVYWTDLPDSITLQPMQQSKTWTYITSMALTDKEARYFYNLGVKLAADVDKLYHSHVGAWEYSWNRGRIDLEGDLPLQKAIYGSMFYILSSLPPLLADKSFYFPFSGLSPGGLAKGAQGADYQGHVFWDMETWMYPPILMFHSSLAKEMLLYRTLRLDAAKDNANKFGCSGAKFPWESAYTGVEVCPGPIYSKNEIHITGDIAYALQQYLSVTWDTDFLTNHRGFELVMAVADFWANRVVFDPTKKLYIINGTEVDPAPDTRDYEQHITGDIAFALQQYIASTGDQKFLKSEKGFKTILNIAEFWKCRAVWNDTRKAYVINDVMGPDEYQRNVNNSAYTNVIAKLSLMLPYYAGKFINTTVPNVYKTIADKLYIPFDKENQYHPEYDGYTRGTIVKQADVILLGFPLMYNMTKEIRKNDLAYYEKYTDDHGPAMTWGLIAVGWLELGNVSRANDVFNRSFTNIQEPFKVWSEVSDGTGAVNFCTGMGGFLQAVLFGYGGFRLYPDYLEFNPVLPPATTRFNITGIDYLGSSLDFVILNDLVTVNMTEHSVGYPDLTLVFKGQKTMLEPGKRVQITRGKAQIIPTMKTAQLFKMSEH